MLFLHVGLLHKDNNLKGKQKWKLGEEFRSCNYEEYLFGARIRDGEMFCKLFGQEQRLKEGTRNGKVTIIKNLSLSCYDYGYVVTKLQLGVVW